MSRGGCLVWVQIVYIDVKAKIAVLFVAASFKKAKKESQPFFAAKQLERTSFVRRTLEGLKSIAAFAASHV